MKQQLKEQVHLRPMTINDLPSVMILENQSYTAPWKENHYRSEIASNPSAYYTVAVLQNQVVGYFGFQLKGDEAHGMTLVVDPKYRGLGIGDKLVGSNLKMMKEKGAKSAKIPIRESNYVSQNLFRKYGFVHTNTLKQTYLDNNERCFEFLLHF